MPQDRGYNPILDAIAEKGRKAGMSSDAITNYQNMALLLIRKGVDFDDPGSISKFIENLKKPLDDVNPRPGVESDRKFNRNSAAAIANLLVTGNNYSSGTKDSLGDPPIYDIIKGMR